MSWGIPTEVAPERVHDWLADFAARHGPPTVSGAEERCLLAAPDGATAQLERFASADGEPIVLPGWAFPAHTIGIVLVRRGGYGVGVGQDTELVVHKCGSRYVQGRTAAGGTSQHRYARRRDNQAAGLVGAVSAHVADKIVPAAARALVVGGDRTLVRDVLVDDRLAALRSLPRREFYDLPDPGFAVLRRALWRGRAVRITVAEAAPPTG